MHTNNYVSTNHCESILVHFTCSHLKSVDYFIEALNPRNRFQGHQTFVFKQMNKGNAILTGEKG